MDIENEAQHDFDDIFSTQWSYKYWKFEDITIAITPKTPSHLKSKNLLIQQWMMSNSFFSSSCRARSRLGRPSKRLVVGQLFSGCERTGEMQKARCLPNAETKQTPKHKHKPNTTRRKTSSKLSETLRFQKDEILGALSTSSRRHSDYRKYKDVPSCP